MPSHLSAALPILAVMTAALAQAAVENTDVRKRMQLMDRIETTLTALSALATGSEPFSTGRAERLARSLATDAAAIPVHFEFQSDDPDSRARREIWTDWPGFATAAARTEAVATTMRTGSAPDLRRDLQRLERSCRACHERYRDADRGASAR